MMLPDVITRTQAFFNAGQIFLRNIAANNLALEHQAGILFTRLYNELHPGELTSTTGLLLVGVVDFSELGDGLAIGNLRRANIDFNLVLPTQDSTLMSR